MKSGVGARVGVPERGFAAPNAGKCPFVAGGRQRKPEQALYKPPRSPPIPPLAVGKGSSGGQKAFMRPARAVRVGCTARGL